ncbi:hypothetical protein HK101_000785, partial [Irineochytrium annulatum]
MAPNKKIVHHADLKRTAARANVRLNWHPAHPMRTVEALRLLFALENQEDLARIAIPDESRFKGGSLSARLLSDAALARRLVDSTSRIVDLGGPGVPCFLVTKSGQSKLFWGQDRLHFVESILAGRPVPQTRMLPVAPLLRRETVTVFWDFSRLQAELGENLHIVNRPVLVGAIFKQFITAAWELDIEIADPVKLAKALDEAGFDGKALVKAADLVEAKEDLKRNVEMALDIGICGVPTYKVRDHVVWGQDRLDHVADLAMGWSPENGNVKLRSVTRRVVIPSMRTPQTMSATIEFFFDVSCPWAYLGSTKIDAVVHRHNASVVFTPVILEGIKRCTATIQYEDLKRTIARANVRFNWHPAHPLRTDEMLRLLFALDNQGDRRRLTHALFRAYWVDNLDLSKPEALLAIARIAVPDESRFKGGSLSLSLLSDPTLAKMLDDSTSRVVALGGPGVPCFCVTKGDQSKLFWGQDRLHFVESILAGRPVPQTRMLPVGPLLRPATVTVYWDFS